MQIKLPSITVDDQTKALHFYTTVLGFTSTAFFTRDIAAEFQRLKSLGVRFRGEPTKMGLVTAVVFEDTCGNLINLVQPAA